MATLEGFLSHGGSPRFYDIQLIQPSIFWGSPLMETSWCLSDEHRVVLGPSAQDADGALQLVVAASAK